MSRDHYPVIIIGGGIVGLSASLFLSYHNVSHLLIERHSGTSVHPRARGFNTRAMEIFHSIQFDEEVIEAGAQLAPSMGFCVGISFYEIMESRSRKKEAKKVDMPFAKYLDGLVSPVKGVRCTQAMLEPVLQRIAKERGGELCLNTECESIEQDDKIITANLRDRETDRAYTVRADYLIAADGAGSPIRKGLGITATGKGALGNLLNILFVADLKEFVKGREISLCYIDRADIRGILTAINNSDIWVFHLCYDPSKGEKASDYTPERCEGILRTIIGISDIEIEIKAILPWQPSDIAASRLQVGRIFLAGDAAHQTTPYAGQGATTGISDVWDLAWKLSLVLKHQAGGQLLETYEIERLPVGQFVAHESGVVTDQYGLPSIKYGPLTFALNGVRRIPMYSGFGYRYTAGAIISESENWWSWLSIPWSIQSLIMGLNGKPGTRAPHVFVQYEGRQVSTLDFFGKAFVLLTGSDGKSWCQATTDVKEKLGVDLIAYRVGPTGELSDPKRMWEYAAGISSRGAVLVRPDGFVAWRVQNQEGHLAERLQAILDKILYR